MEIEKEIQGKSTVLHVNGALDTQTAPALEGAIEPELAARESIVIDLAHTEYISSAGLRVLLATQKAMQAKGGTLTVKNPNAMARELFEMTGFDSVLTIA